MGNCVPIGVLIKNDDRLRARSQQLVVRRQGDKCCHFDCVLQRG